jgi:alginate O-acetyltransferase complex protein AlgI
MVFSSAVFLFAFLPVVFILHTVIRNTTARNVLLIVASLIFYAWGEPVYVVLLLASILINYLLGRFVWGRKPVLVAAVIVNLAFLIVFKYAGFIVQSINVLPFISLKEPKISMPIGISFYTFQAMSYVIDTYRDERKRPGSFLDVMLYVCLFPQLVAGPIVKYNSVREQLQDRQVSAEGTASGIQRFIVGLSKKMLIANVMAVAADRMFALDIAQLDMASAWVGAVCYMLQIYFDFSGYSDMAVGMGKMFGFSFPENFDYPYTACSIRQFWKKWHISLTSWFREYLYFPLGGNRKGRARTLFNRFFVFLCTGIWHGADWTFVVWGIYHGVLTMLETVLVKDKNAGKAADSAKPVIRVLGHIYTLLAVMIGFVIFRADSMRQAVHFIVSMFSFGATAVGTMTAVSVMSPLFIITLIITAVACTPVLRMLPKNAVTRLLGMVLTIILYMLCIMEIAAGSYNPFIYFRF